MVQSCVSPGRWWAVRASYPGSWATRWGALLCPAQGCANGARGGSVLDRAIKSDARYGCSCGDMSRPVLGRGETRQ